jgi:membrane protein DedA with SNARE-associated domain
MVGATAGYAYAQAVDPIAFLITHGQLERWLSHYGYLAVFLLVGMESIGLPVPGETMLIVAAVYAAATGKLSIVLIVAVAAAGAVVGDNIGYAVGRYGGWRLLRRYGRHVRIDESKLKLGRYLFMRHGGKVVFFGRFVSLLRTYAAALAGANHMRFRRFFGFNASGGISWAAIYGFGYFYIADVLRRLGTPVGIAFGVIAAAVALGLFLVVRRNLPAWEERAERALPGPLTAPMEKDVRGGSAGAR